MSRLDSFSPRRWASARGCVSVSTFLIMVTLPACSGGVPSLPPPRPLVIHSGARVSTTPERMQEVDLWVREELDNIETDPTFMIETVPTAGESYVWEGMLISNDTARIRTSRRAPESRVSHLIYAHLHLMDRLGRQAEWLPRGGNLRGFELEKAILERVAESWLYGRAVFSATPYAPLDELVYAYETGHLDAMILTARQDEFPDEVRRWLEDDPGAMESYRQWFVDTFSREPPGLREVIR